MFQNDTSIARQRSYESLQQSDAAKLRGITLMLVACLQNKT
jgi:hypothetical protein